MLFGFHQSVMLSICRTKNSLPLFALDFKSFTILRFESRIFFSRFPNESKLFLTVFSIYFLECFFD